MDLARASCGTSAVAHVTTVWQRGGHLCQAASRNLGMTATLIKRCQDPTYATIRHFRHNLEGRNFFVNTDHKPLTYVMTSVTERPSLRQTRQLAFIDEFTTDIRYVKGETNFAADALSRPSVSFIDSTSTINYKKLRADQAIDTEFTRLRHSMSSTMNFTQLLDYSNYLKTIWFGVMSQKDTFGRILQQNFEKMFFRIYMD